jgi:hypothetical protein
MTNEQCSLKFCEKVDSINNYLHLPSGTTEKDENNVQTFGFKDTVLSRLNLAASLYNKNIEYKKGDIVSYFNKIFISKKNFNKGNNPFTNPFFWIKIEGQTINENAIIKGYLLYKDGNIIDSINVDSVDVYNNRFTVNFTNSYDNNYVCIVRSTPTTAEDSQSIKGYSKGSGYVRIYIEKDCGGSASDNSSFELYILTKSN